MTMTDLFTIRRRYIAPYMLDDVLRKINMNLFERGILPDEIKNYRETASWFPWLRDDYTIRAVEAELPKPWRTGELCEPQIMLQPPDARDTKNLVMHVDEEPPWAEGRKYLRIVGVPLTPSHRANGGLVVHLRPDTLPVSLDMDPSDIVMMKPSLYHCSGANRTGNIRYALYFRYLEDK